MIIKLGHKDFVPRSQVITYAFIKTLMSYIILNYIIISSLLNITYIIIILLTPAPTTHDPRPLVKLQLLILKLVKIKTL